MHLHRKKGFFGAKKFSLAQDNFYFQLIMQKIYWGIRVNKLTFLT